MFIHELKEMVVISLMERGGFQIKGFLADQRKLSLQIIVHHLSMLISVPTRNLQRLVVTNE